MEGTIACGGVVGGVVLCFLVVDVFGVVAFRLAEEGLQVGLAVSLHQESIRQATRPRSLVVVSSILHPFQRVFEFAATTVSCLCVCVSVCLCVCVCLYAVCVCVCVSVCL